MAFFFGESVALSAIDAFDDDARDELGGGAVAEHLLREHFKLDGELVFLAPFDEFALVVFFLLRHFVDVDEAAEDDVAHEFLADGIAAVEVEGSEEGFEGIAVHVTVVGRRDGAFVQDEFVEPDLHGELVEGVAAHEFAAQGGEVAFLLVGVALVEQVGDDGAEDGVAEVFEPLVVDVVAFVLASAG